MEFIEAQEQDRFFLAEVCRDVAILYNPIFPLAFDKQAERFIEQGLPKDYRIFLIQKEDQRVGFMGYVQLSEDVVYLTSLYIKSQYRGKGYGTQAIQAFIQEWKEQGIQEILLLAHKDAHWAINFYKGQGFKIIEDSLIAIQRYKNGLLEKHAVKIAVLMAREEIS